MSKNRKRRRRGFKPRKYSEHQFLKRAGSKNTHHLTPKGRGGRKSKYNEVELDIYRHNAYHLLFGNLTFKEAGELLLRMCSIKEIGKGL